VERRIGSRRRAEEALRESEARFRGVFENSGVGMLLWNREGLYIDVNKTMCEFIGYSREEVLSLSIIDLSLLDDLSQNSDIVSQIWSGQTGNFCFEKRLIHKDGSILWGTITVSALQDANGKAQYLLAALQDITLRKQAEEVRNSIFELSPDLIGVADANTQHFKLVNPAWEIFGRPLEEFTSRPFSDFIHPDDQGSTVQQVEHLRTGEFVHGFVNRYRCKDGSYRNIEWRATPAQADGTVYATGRDITERKAAEEAILASETRYRDLVNQSSDVVWQMNLKGVITFISPSVQVMSGANPNEIIGMRLDTFIKTSFAAESRVEARKILHDALGGESGSQDIVVELIHRHSDGSKFVGEIRAVHLKGLDGEIVGIQGITRDITERRQAEEAIKELNRRNEFLLNSVGEGIYGLNAEGEATFVNPTAANLLGWRSRDLIGKSMHSVIHHTKEDGSSYPAEDCPIYRAFRDGLIHHIDNEVFWRKDGTSFAVDYTSTPIRSEDDSLIGAVVVFRDITERKRMEEELQKIEKLETIGVLAGGLAHDLNNYLTGIVGNIGLAQMYADPAEKDKRLLIAEEDAMRVKELTQRLLTFAKGGLPVLELSDLEDVLRDAVGFTMSGSNLSCDYALPDKSLRVEIDKGQITQVINNIVINAQQAMPEGGKIKVSMDRIELDKESNIPLPVGSYVWISIGDRGVGIPEEVRKRIFDPFFSTKPTGSGLGLATSYSIIQKHGGYISVESEVGVGTKLTFYLPVSKAESTSQKDDVNRLAIMTHLAG